MESLITIAYIGAESENYSQQVFSCYSNLMSLSVVNDIFWVRTKAFSSSDYGGITIIDFPDANASEARNMAINNCTSKFIVLVDSDMLIDGEAFLRFSDFLIKNKLASSKYSDYYLNTRKERVRYEGVSKLRFCGGFIAFDLELLGELRYDTSMNRMQDVLFSYKLSKRVPTEIPVFPELLYSHLTIDYNDSSRYASLSLHNFYKFRGKLFYKAPMIIFSDKSILWRLSLLLVLLFYPIAGFSLYFIVFCLRAIRIRSFIDLKMILKTDFGFYYGLYEEVYYSILRVCKRFYSVI